MQFSNINTSLSTDDLIWEDEATQQNHPMGTSKKPDLSWGGQWDSWTGLRHQDQEEPKG